MTSFENYARIKLKNQDCKAQLETTRVQAPCIPNKSQNKRTKENDEKIRNKHALSKTSNPLLLRRIIPSPNLIRNLFRKLSVPIFKVLRRRV